MAMKARMPGGPRKTITSLTVKVKSGECPCRCHTSTSSAADSPAKTSASPARAEESTGHARVFGASTRDSFASFDPATSSWRTSQLSLDGGLSVFSETWPRAGMTRSGTASRLRPLAPLTDATGSGLLHTPTAKANQDAPSMRSRDAGSWFRDERWPTPSARDWKDSGDGRMGRGQLPDAVRESYKTPTSAPLSHGGSGDELHKQVAPNGGPLNPQWVAWLMGFPIDWTSLPTSGTRSSHRSRNGSAGASSSGRS